MKKTSLFLITSVVVFAATACGKNDSSSSSPAPQQDPATSIQGSWVNYKVSMPTYVVAEKITGTQITQCSFPSDVVPPKPGTVVGPFAYSFQNSAIDIQNGALPQQTYSTADSTIHDPTYGTFYRPTNEDLSILNEEGCGF